METTASYATTITAQEMRDRIRKKTAETALVQAMEKIARNHPEITPNEALSACRVAVEKVLGGDRA